MRHSDTTESTATTARSIVNIRIDPALLDRFDAEARRRVVSRTFLVERALEQFLNAEVPA